VSQNYSSTMNLFGRPKPKAAPKISESIQKLRESQETLEKREQHLCKQMEQAGLDAKKKLKAKDKRGAMFHLKRKKMLEKQVEQIYGKKTNLEIQIMALENAASNRDMIDAMVSGREALKAVVGDAEIEKAQDVMEDITEALQLSDELGEALSTQIGPSMDEDELLGELGELESELADEDILAMDSPSVPVRAAEKQVDVADMPAVPQTKVPRGRVETAAEKEAREFAELESMMAMWTGSRTVALVLHRLARLTDSIRSTLSPWRRRTSKGPLLVPSSMHAPNAPYRNDCIASMFIFTAPTPCFLEISMTI